MFVTMNLASNFIKKIFSKENKKQYNKKKTLIQKTIIQQKEIRYFLYYTKTVDHEYCVEVITVD